MIYDYIEKSSTESIPVTLDASLIIPTGATILSAAVVVTDDDGTAVTDTMAPSGATFVGTTVTVLVAAGTSGRNYLATVTVVTDIPSTHADTFNIRVRDDAAEKYFRQTMYLGEFKSLMRITSDEYDDQLTMMIPQLKAWVMEYTKNEFPASSIVMSSTTLAFTTGTSIAAPYITDAQSMFLYYGMASNIDILVKNTLNNNGLFHVDTAAAGTLTLATTDEVITEAAPYTSGNIGIVATIQRVKFPGAVKSIIAQTMAELLGDYTAKSKWSTERDLSESIKTLLKPYRRVRLT